MKKQLLIIGICSLTFAAFGLGLLIGQTETEKQYELLIASLEDIHRVQLDLYEERCNERIYHVLNQIDMEHCFGRWVTADGPIEVEPTERKRRKE